jgi:hypothetical protein
LPSAVIYIHRDSDTIGDGAPNSGGVFLGFLHLQPARSTLAWFVAHGYTIRLLYVRDEAAARAAHPAISFDVGSQVRDEGAAILAANPSIVSTALTPRVKASGVFPPSSSLSLSGSRSSL